MQVLALIAEPSCVTTDARTVVDLLQESDLVFNKIKAIGTEIRALEAEADKLIYDLEQLRIQRERLKVTHEHLLYKTGVVYKRMVLALGSSRAP